MVDESVVSVGDGLTDAPLSDVFGYVSRHTESEFQAANDLPPPSDRLSIAIDARHDNASAASSTVSMPSSLQASSAVMSRGKASHSPRLAPSLMLPGLIQP